MKRPNGSGTVVRLSGNRRRPFAVRVSARDQRGRVFQRTLSYHASSQEAYAALDAYNLARSAGQAPAPDQLSITLQEVFNGWSAKAYRKLKQPSIASHNAAWNKRISRFANRPMRSISLDEWQSILDEDEDEGRSQSLINNDVILIKALNQYAMERDIIVKDYSRFLDIPTVGIKVAKGTLSDLQLVKLEQMAAAGEPWADTVLMLCYTGFRISEFLALTPFSYHAEDGGYLQGGGKTEAGKNRIVPVHPKIRGYLSNWLSKSGDTIICDNSGRAIAADKYREMYFHPLMEQLGIPEATPHWCRHTFATRLHTAGADALTIKWLMGHSTESDITAHYTHKNISVLQAAVRLLA